jgi:hypothetical protein
MVIVSMMGKYDVAERCEERGAKRRALSPGGIAIHSLGNMITVLSKSYMSEFLFFADPVFLI